MGEGETVNEYFARTLAIANHVTTHGERMEQQRRKGQKYHSEEQALKVSNAGRGRGKGASQGRGRGRQNKDLVECYKYHKLRHYRSECSDWEGNANYAELKDEEEMLLMAHSNLNKEHKEEAWYLDSGCNNQMVGTKDWLFEFDESFKESVKLGNVSKMTVMGKGNVKLSIGGRIHVITDMCYLPGLVIIPRCLQVKTVEESNLWHNMYVHISIKGLKVLNKKHMVKRLPELKEIEDKCTDCLSGKQHMKSIPKQANWRVSQKLELVHSNIYGPINPQSNGGN
ncbi:copia-type polyprotein, partial [Trifolium medium]|nr:copia-type polyprotein [Trifolium medium]